MKSFTEFSEATDRLKKIKKDTDVSFTHQQSGKKITGKYKGLHRMGGRSYAKVETGKEMHMVPTHHIH